MDGSASPEERAVQWLIEEDPRQLQFSWNESADNRGVLRNRFALVTFYFCTGGPSWLNNTGWLEAEDGCSWRGIWCTNFGVGQIGYDGTLENNNLQGTIPIDLALLDEPLYELRLSNNPGLVGSLPSSFGRLRGLERLELTNCRLSSSLPDEVGELTRLTDFEIGSNAFTGTLSPAIGNWSDLDTFEIYSNGFSGSLPESISSWSQLLVRTHVGSAVQSIFE